ncbi:MAG TPA: sigma-54 dependent transcriptional regulator [Myxococcales bacterium]|nr:sigma-54 dependent transcriptional regulator [Myxococcales bacterium]
MNVRPKLLVVDDDPVNRKLVSAVFETESFDVTQAADGAGALDQAAKSAPDVVFLDVRMPGLSGIDTLRKLKASAPHIPVVMLTSHAEVNDAVEAIKLGAYDFLTRPIHNDHLVVVARRALEKGRLEAEVRTLRQRVSAAGDLVRLMGPSEPVRTIVKQVEGVASSPLTVLILGDTGTGKELVARAIHHQSDRSQGPFVPLDCGAIPENMVEQELFGHEIGAFNGAESRRPGHMMAAEHGTLFLDEVGNLSAAVQIKLLRVLQEKRVQPVGSSRSIPVDVRFIAATNGELKAQMEKGTFRQDLYYRLAEFTLQLPQLRARPDDIVPLAMRFLEEAATELRRPVALLSDDAQKLLRAHAWPGNVRELRNVVRQAVLQARGVTVEAEEVHRLLGSPGMVQAEAPPLPTGSLRQIAAAAAAEAEKSAILAALHAAHSNKSEAARLLKTDFKTLHLKMKRYGLTAD